eukprot:CAMPEP_0198719828 /NCGR_PEP_ID=MMETSP1471-20131121/58485_1 /TAXON_ID=41880 /ORGANISM="Pycnococcus provasolii, Strain RCC733" /LENGTH=134 /DNA_ID=CAMNT_0044480613 /DNA_START=203 /DNA_END=608 /DNA_ORIENTATION=+
MPPQRRKRRVAETETLLAALPTHEVRTSLPRMGVPAATSKDVARSPRQTLFTFRGKVAVRENASDRRGAVAHRWLARQSCGKRRAHERLHAVVVARADIEPVRLEANDVRKHSSDVSAQNDNQGGEGGAERTAA